MQLEKNISAAIKQGPKSSQEDRFCMGEKSGNTKFMAVMDGHSGDKVSRLCFKYIKEEFDITQFDDLEVGLRALMQDLDSQTNEMEEGSTISAICIADDKRSVSIAVLGDSPVFVLDKEGELHVSPEHNVRSNLDECNAAEDRGGLYVSGYIYSSPEEKGLQLSRALGNVKLGKVVSHEPEIYTIKNPRSIVVASDGLIDPGHSGFNDVCIYEIKELMISEANADKLMEWAEKRGLEDNVSVVVWHNS